LSASLVGREGLLEALPFLWEMGFRGKGNQFKEVNAMKWVARENAQVDSVLARLKQP